MGAEILKPGGVAKFILQNTENTPFLENMATCVSIVVKFQEKSCMSLSVLTWHEV